MLTRRHFAGLLAGGCRFAGRRPCPAPDPGCRHRHAGGRRARLEGPGSTVAHRPAGWRERKRPARPLRRLPRRCWRRPSGSGPALPGQRLRRRHAGLQRPADRDGLHRPLRPMPPPGWTPTAVSSRWWRGGGRRHHLLRRRHVVRADSGITNLEGMRGKSLAWADPNSASGYLIPRFALRRRASTWRPTSPAPASPAGTSRRSSPCCSASTMRAVTWASGQGDAATATPAATCAPWSRRAC